MAKAVAPVEACPLSEQQQRRFGDVIRSYGE
jgi:hypothetical protein